MSENDPKGTGSWQAAVYRLVQKTRKGELKWENDSSFKPTFFVNHAFRAEHQGDLLRLYRQIHFEGPSGMIDPRLMGHLEFIDSDGKVVWSFPPHQSINDLLTVVEYQTGETSIIEKKIQKILEAA